jgi:chorismate mutase / prephenate dehydratase
VTADRDDPVIKHFRAQISDNDRAIVELVNKRLRLVEQIRAYKISRGLQFVDPEREQWMLTYLQRANRGPLSQAGLAELFEEVLNLTKREVEHRDELDPQTAS